MRWQQVLDSITALAQTHASDIINVNYYRFLMQHFRASQYFIPLSVLIYARSEDLHIFPLTVAIIFSALSNSYVH